ncbi:MAG: hypothetical protein WDM79_07155 [Terricaulis sp.]
MSEKSARTKTARPGRELGFTIFKSGLSGAAVTVLAVALSSPAGLGGMIGSSFAGPADARDPIRGNDGVSFAPASTQLSAEEMTDIATRLEGTVEAIESARAATDAKIEHMRTIAAGQSMTSFADAQPVRDANAELADLLLRGTSPS